MTFQTRNQKASYCERHVYNLEGLDVWRYAYIAEGTVFAALTWDLIGRHNRSKPRGFQTKTEGFGVVD